MKYGLIGEKLGHSFSKVIHESFAPYEYTLMPLEKDELDGFMISREFAAINVTIPYKQDVIKYLDYIDENAKKIGAVNTIVNHSGRLYGYNTDFGGLKKLIEKNDFQLNGKKVLILGTGGTSKTANAVCESLGAKQIIKVSRRGEINYQNVLSCHGDADFIINTTPCGMYPNGDESPINLDGFNNLQGVIDVVYNPLRTKLASQAAERGIKSCCGLYMLASQAVLASEIFLGTKYSEDVFDKAYNFVLGKKLNIVLIGMPGSGKTTIGKALAEKLKSEFIDTDELIVKSEGREITDIFATDGEEYFRKEETKAIKQASEKNGVVIATGGGAVLKKENVDYLKSNGKIFFLDRPIDDIMPTADRPLAKDRQAVINRYNERYPLYKAAANQIIKIDGIVEHAVNKIIAAMNGD